MEEAIDELGYVDYSISELIDRLRNVQNNNTGDENRPMRDGIERVRKLLSTAMAELQNTIADIPSGEEYTYEG